MAKFNSLPLSELKSIFPKIKMSIKYGLKRIAISHNVTVVKFLVPATDIPLNCNRLKNTKTISISEFHKKLFHYCVEANFDCVYITYNQRNAICLVSPRFQSILPLEKAKLS